jgi:flavin-dependent dehydrogenase
MTASTEVRSDIVIVGAGIAGLTAAIMLARAGRQVVCIDPVPPPGGRVGESLDWAAPPLLEQVGLPVHRVVGEGMGTVKREVHGVSTSGQQLVGRPPEWLARWPLRFRFDTVHVDRERFETALYSLAIDAGVQFLWEPVVKVEVAGDRVVRCRLRSVEWITGRWYLDGSGRARLFARAFAIDRVTSGHSRAAIWTQSDTPQELPGTSLYLDDGPGDLRWAWEIPLSADRHSVGMVIPDSEFQARWRRSAEADCLLAETLAALPTDARPRLNDGSEAKTRAFRCYTHSRVSGDNWIMIGEAASFVDPLSSTGVSTAMRHGVEAAEIVQLTSPATVARALRRFDRRVRFVSNLYNEAIEALLYSPDLRNTVGIRSATRAYVIVGFGMTALYTRIGGIGPVRHGAVLAVGSLLRLWLRTWTRFVMHPLQGRRPGRQIELDSSPTEGRVGPLG